MAARRFQSLHKFIALVTLLITLAGMSACKTTQPDDLLVTPGSIWSADGNAPQVQPSGSLPTQSYRDPAARAPGAPAVSPTPDAPHYQGSDSNPNQPKTYIVQSGDWLSTIAQRYGVTVDALVKANNIANPNVLVVGQKLIIPAGTPQPTGPSFKIIPDSELVYGPLSGKFDVSSFIHESGGYLSSYSQMVGSTYVDAATTIRVAAQEFSINPRILLALIEYRTGWVSNPNPTENKDPFGPLGNTRSGLHDQIIWVVATLNDGYYRWRSGQVTDWSLADGSNVPIDPSINAGTASVQNFFARVEGHSGWLKDVSAGGFADTYTKLFGPPFDLAIEPLVSQNLAQPPLLLPFNSGEVWAFTGGPHLAWDFGTPLGALDFAPPGEAKGCVATDKWVTAVADGVITRTGLGDVIEDLDFDGNEGSGWDILYMHIESGNDRVKPGTKVKAGDPIGHPSCEGGISSGTHVHLARKFNGEWMSAIGSTPFNLSGWISSGNGENYVGNLTRNGVEKQAYEGDNPINQIER
jgi:murein DD-endopeptidase MepM/ murein hydrolase activator NlpD